MPWQPTAAADASTLDEGPLSSRGHTESCICVPMGRGPPSWGIGGDHAADCRPKPAHEALAAAAAHRNSCFETTP